MAVVEKVDQSAPPGGSRKRRRQVQDGNSPLRGLIADPCGQVVQRPTGGIAAGIDSQ
jgi:hypothetical protein